MATKVVSTKGCSDGLRLQDRCVGRNDLEDLHRFKQVCCCWNLFTKKITKHKKDTIRTALVKYDPILTAHYYSQDQTRYDQINSAALHLKISTAASLASHGLLSYLDIISLCNVDLESVPDEGLASLVSCVERSVRIENVNNCNIILDSVKSKWLTIKKQTLTSEETRTLVRAMESKVEKVQLGLSGAEDVTLDVAALTQYSGKGKCETVYCENIFIDKYEAELRNWVKRTDSLLDESFQMPRLYMRRNFKTFCRLANFVLPFPII